MSNEYFVSLDVVWSTIVEADNEEEAIDKAIAECDYDPDASIEPYVCLREDMGK